MKDGEFQVVTNGATEPIRRCHHERSEIHGTRPEEGRPTGNPRVSEALRAE